VLHRASPQLPSVAEFKVRGVCAATFTQFTESGELDLANIAPYIAELKRGSVKYVFGECCARGATRRNSTRRVSWLCRRCCAK
jgi:hypothetical protein